MSESIEMGTEVWVGGENSAGPFEYICFRGCRHFYFCKESGQMYNDTPRGAELTTTDPHEEKRPWADALPPGCEVWTLRSNEGIYEGYKYLHFESMKKSASSDYYSMISKHDFRGFLYKLSGGGYRVASFYPAWESSNDNLRSVYHSNAEEAILIGAEIKATK